MVGRLYRSALCHKGRFCDGRGMSGAEDSGSRYRIVVTPDVVINRWLVQRIAPSTSSIL
jgi:hypothetical protein